MENSAFRSIRFQYDGNLPDTSNAWADLLEEVEEVDVPVVRSHGDYAASYLAALGTAAFEVRLAQGLNIAGTDYWFVEDTALPIAASVTNLSALVTPGEKNGQKSPVGLPLFKVQIKTASAVSRALIVVANCWMGR